MLKELKDYGWELADNNPFEFSSKYECIWIHLKHEFFPEIHLCIETEFVDGLKSKSNIIIVDENIDNAGDSAEVYTQTEFDAEVIWKECNKVLQGREERLEK